ncbi:MAG: methyltransferase domain-containing protein [Actinomadura sp.]
MDQFTYFDHQLGNPDWTGKRVLDFGGNVGNLLYDPNCRIEPSNYWSIDVSRDSITEGQRRHPKAHFIFYDRYNYEYNPTGTIGEPIPDRGIRFDFIVAWSVVTHNDKVESLDLVDQLVALLADDGKLAFTFMDPLWTPPAGWAREAELPGLSNLHRLLAVRREGIKPDMDVEGLLARAENTTLTWVNLIGADQLTLDPEDDGLTDDKRYSRTSPDSDGDGGGGGELGPGHRPSRVYVACCTPEYMQRLFPGAQILPPVEPERHHCAIIEKRLGAGTVTLRQSGCR